MARPDAAGGGGGGRKGAGRERKSKTSLSVAHAPGGSRLPERDVGDRAASAQDANSALPPACKDRHALHDVAAVGDLHDMGSESVGAVSGVDDGRLGFVLGTGRSPSWSS